MLCAINVNKAVELEFSIQVQGTTAKSIEPRFVIVGPDFAVTCFCTPEKDQIKVRIPKLEGILPLGKHQVRFEVILGDQLCVAMKDEVELKGKSKLDQDSETKPTISVSFASSPTPKKVKEEVEQCEFHPEPIEPSVEISDQVVVSEVVESEQPIEKVETVEPPVEPIVEQVVEAAPTMSLMQQVQAYKAPHPEFNVDDYISSSVARSGQVVDKTGFSLIKKLSK